MENFKKTLAELQNEMFGQKKDDQRIVLMMAFLEELSKRIEVIPESTMTEIASVFENLLKHVKTLKLSKSRGFREKVFLEQDLVELSEIKDFFSSQIFSIYPNDSSNDSAAINESDLCIESVPNSHLTEDAHQTTTQDNR